MKVSPPHPVYSIIKNTVLPAAYATLGYASEIDSRFPSISTMKSFLPDGSTFKGFSFKDAGTKLDRSFQYFMQMFTPSNTTLAASPGNSTTIEESVGGSFFNNVFKIDLRNFFFKSLPTAIEDHSNEIKLAAGIGFLATVIDGVFQRTAGTKNMNPWLRRSLSIVLASGAAIATTESTGLNVNPQILFDLAKKVGAVYLVVMPTLTTTWYGLRLIHDSTRLISKGIEGACKVGMTTANALTLDLWPSETPKSEETFPKKPDPLTPTVNPAGWGTLPNGGSAADPLAAAASPRRPATPPASEKTDPLTPTVNPAGWGIFSPKEVPAADPLAAATSPRRPATPPTSEKPDPLTPTADLAVRELSLSMSSDDEESEEPAAPQKGSEDPLTPKKSDQPRIMPQSPDPLAPNPAGSGAGSEKNDSCVIS